MTLKLITATLLAMVLILPVSVEAASPTRWDAVRHHPDNRPILRKNGRFMPGTTGSAAAYLLLGAQAPAFLPALGAFVAGSAVAGAVTWLVCRRIEC